MDDELIDALKDAEGDARLEHHGYVFFNGIRYVDHPPSCGCAEFRYGQHCWCCGYHELDKNCGCNYSADLQICDCGYCVPHCHCKSVD